MELEAAYIKDQKQFCTSWSEGLMLRGKEGREGGEREDRRQEASPDLPEKIRKAEKVSIFIKSCRYLQY